MLWSSETVMKRIVQTSLHWRVKSMYMQDERLSDALKPEEDISIVNGDSITPTSWHELSWLFIGVRGSFFLWVSAYPIPSIEWFLLCQMLLLRVALIPFCLTLPSEFFCLICKDDLLHRKILLLLRIGSDKIWAYLLSADRVIKFVHHLSYVGTHHWCHDKWGWILLDLL